MIGTSCSAVSTATPAINKGRASTIPLRFVRIPELRAEAEQQLQAERDGQRYSMNRQEMVNLLIEIITSSPDKATLHNPLCEVRYVGKEGRMVAAFPEQGQVHGIAN
jgi:hypothetical protein